MSLLRINGKGTLLMKFDLRNPGQRCIKLHCKPDSHLTLLPKKNPNLRKLSNLLNKNLEAGSKLTWCQQRYFNQTKANANAQSNLQIDKEFADYFEQIEMENLSEIEGLDLGAKTHNYEEILNNTDKVNENHSTTSTDSVVEDYTRKTKTGQFRTRFQYEMSVSPTVLSNFLQACIHADLTDGAFKHFLVFAKQKAQSVNIKVFELMFLSVLNLPKPTTNASSLDKLDLLFSFLKTYELKPSPLISACAIGSLVKFLDINQTALQDFYTNTIPDHSFNECLNACHRDSDTFKYCKKAILIMDPNFKFVPGTITSKTNKNTLPLLETISKQKASKNAMLLKSEMETMNIKQLFQEQLSQEINQVVSIPRVLNNNAQSQSFIKKKRKELTQLHNTWLNLLVKGINDCKEEEKGRWVKNTSMKRGLLYPFLCLLSPEEYAKIILWKMYEMHKNGEITLITCCDLGQAVYNRYAVKHLLENDSEKRLMQIYKEYIQLYTSKNKTDVPREFWENLALKYGDVRPECSTQQWKDLWKLTVGKKLLEIMVSVLSFEVGVGGSKVPPAYVSIPAAFNSYKAWGKKMYGMTLPHPLYVKLVQDAAHDFSFSNSFLPMVVPPTPWLDPEQGGLLLTPTRFIRQPDNYSKLDCISVKHQNASAITDAINVLSSVAWRINKRVLDIQLKVFKSKGDAALQIPQAVDKNLPPCLNPIHDEDPNKQRLLRLKAHHAKKSHREMYSLFMDGLYKFSIANHYRDKIIWFPHNLDFRGRMYPVPPYFNYMGSDVNRSLFLFANGKPLGKKGLDWLKIHLINLTGFKKMSSLSNRLKYADEVLDKIMDSADNPLNGEGWWRMSDEPWQTLVACIELTEALRSPDPEKYVSCVPIYQDGSCNGLQHYAAMGRDVDGAEQVNLSPSVTPKDVYSRVAEKVEERRAKDAANGKELAILLEGFIERKLVKQSIMTTVYGVTKFGATRQIKRQLQSHETFPPEQYLKASMYVCVLLFECLASMFTGASEIQHWFTSLARCMSNKGNSVEWITPLGLHVVQPYFQMNTVKMLTTIQALNYQYPSRKPNTKKQCNAFPANFVHSLDSTHMMLTALHCHHAGIKFNAIHDCYWTHACDIDAMNVICRDEFVKLHSQPILSDLSQHLSQFASQDPDQSDEFKTLLNQIPSKGDFNLNDIKKSTFFFS